VISVQCTVYTFSDRSPASSARCSLQPHPFTVQPHLLAVQHRPLAVSITSSLSSLTRPLKKLFAHSSAFLDRCPLSSLVWSKVQPRLLAIKPLLFIVQLYHILVPALTSQLTSHYVLYSMYTVQPLPLSCLSCSLSSLACSFSTHVYSLLSPVPEIIDPVFAKTSPKRSFSITEYERFGLVFTKTRVYKFGHCSLCILPESYSHAPSIRSHRGT
jgi:hypothetical protein